METLVRYTVPMKDERSSTPTGFEESDEYWFWILYGESNTLSRGSENES